MTVPPSYRPEPVRPPRSRVFIPREQTTGIAEYIITRQDKL